MGHPVAQRGGRWRATGVLDFEPAMIGSREYEFASVGMFASVSDAGFLRALLLAYGFRQDELDHTLRRRFMAYTLLHRYSHLGWYLRRMPPGPGVESLEALADEWWAWWRSFGKWLPVYADLWLQKSAPLEAINHALEEALDDVTVPSSEVGRLAKTTVKKVGALGASVDFGAAPARRPLPAAPELRLDALVVRLAAAADKPILLMLDEIHASRPWAMWQMAHRSSPPCARCCISVAISSNQSSRDRRNPIVREAARPMTGLEAQQSSADVPSKGAILQTGRSRFRGAGRLAMQAMRPQFDQPYWRCRPKLDLRLSGSALARGRLGRCQGPVNGRSLSALCGCCFEVAMRRAAAPRRRWRA